MNRSERLFKQIGHFQVVFTYDVTKNGRPTKNKRMQVKLLEVRKGRRRKMIVAYRHLYAGDRFVNALDKASILAEKLEKLWPCHPLAKEYPNE